MGIAFDEFWQLYPRKIGKLDAQRSYEKALTRATIDQIREAVKKFARAVEKKDPQYVAHPATWLNQGRWDDEPMTRTHYFGAAPQFPPEHMLPARPRSCSWYNVWVPDDAPQYDAMCKRANDFDADRREFSYDKGGIWVSRKWLQDDMKRPYRQQQAQSSA